MTVPVAPIAAADIALLRRIPVFAKLPEPLLAALARTGPVRHFDPGERLIKQHAAGDHALALLSGTVEVANDSRHGRARMARIAAPALVGEVGALARLRRNASVIATTPVRALRIDRDTLLDVCRLAPDALLTVIGHLGRQIQTLNGALGMYTAGCEALGKDSLDPEILEDLRHPSAPLHSFALAFEELARNIARERRQRAEMASAALLQRAMLPQDTGALPPCRRCDVAGLMQPARNVGGDFFDILMLDDDRLAVVVGDVCGKGVPACLFMCVTMTMLRLAARDAVDGVAAMLERVNASICAQNPSAMFATMTYGVLDLASGRFDYVNCGNNPPFVLRRDGGDEQLTMSGIPLGVAPDKRFAAQSIELGPGDGLFLFTDGVTESNDPHGEEFGEARLAEALRQHRHAGAAGLVAAIAAEVAGFADTAEQFDDITCLALVMPDD